MQCLSMSKDDFRGVDYHVVSLLIFFRRRLEQRASEEGVPRSKKSAGTGERALRVDRSQLKLPTDLC
jgi:hypothetical protein